tara:strand:- start:64 stop:582 length:519 start_codon:yes stop_codon:yes gene_type:complete
MKKRWDTDNALERANEYIKSMEIPKFETGFDISGKDAKAPTFKSLIEASLEDVGNYLIYFGAFRALLEQYVADLESRKGAMSAHFDEAYNVLSFELLREYDMEERKRPTKEATRGEIFLKNEELGDLRRSIIEVEAMYQQALGRLKLYTSAVATISRVITIRTGGFDNDRRN